MLFHMLIENCLLYHHEIITIEDTETKKKIYQNHKEAQIKGDGQELVKKVLLFLGIEMNKSEIQLTNKLDYKKKKKTFNI